MSDQPSDLWLTFPRRLNTKMDDLRTEASKVKQCLTAL